MQIALIGASGFVGRHVRDRMIAAGHTTNCVGRAEVSDPARLPASLRDCQWIVNCAGQKRPREDGSWYGNDQLPADLYTAAASAGCIGMIHLSSVAAIASVTTPGDPADDRTVPAPDTPYGQSKLRGDERLAGSRTAATSLCILRPPLLFGRDAPGLFGLLRRAAIAGIPLPLRGIAAERSIMHVANLAEAVASAIEAGIDGTFIVTDPVTVRPGELYRKMLSAAGHRNRTFPIGKGGHALLKLALGKRRSDSLLSDSRFDGSRFVEMTGCSYPLDLDAAIAEAMQPA